MRTLKDGIMRKMGKWKVSKFVELFFCQEEWEKNSTNSYSGLFRAH